MVEFIPECPREATAAAAAAAAAARWTHLTYLLPITDDRSTRYVHAQELGICSRRRRRSSWRD